jgi:hypothetical protein
MTAGGFNIISPGNGANVWNVDNEGNTSQLGNLTVGGNLYLGGTSVIGTQNAAVVFPTGIIVTTEVVTSTLTAEGVIVQNGGINTSAGIATLSNLTLGTIFPTGWGRPLSDTTRDYTVYANVATGGANNTIAISSLISGSYSTLVLNGTCQEGSMWSFRVPAGWFVAYNGGAILGPVNAVSC